MLWTSTFAGFFLKTRSTWLANQWFPVYQSVCLEILYPGTLPANWGGVSFCWNQMFLYGISKSVSPGKVCFLCFHYSIPSWLIFSLQKAPIRIICQFLNNCRFCNIFAHEIFFTENRHISGSVTISVVEILHFSWILTFTSSLSTFLRWMSF